LKQNNSTYSLPENKIDVWGDFDDVWGGFIEERKLGNGGEEGARGRRVKDLSGPEIDLQKK